MRKLLSLLMVLSLLLVLCACDMENNIKKMPDVNSVTNETLQKNKDGYTFSFSLLDENKEEIEADVTVKLRIVNNNNETVYKETVTLSPEYDDFSVITDKNTGESNLKAKIILDYWNIDFGTVSEGELYYQVVANNDLIFDEKSLQITGLESITYPILPQTIHTYTNNNNIADSVKITNVYYESGHLYFSGEKTFDWEGDSNSDVCRVGWKLYDSEGYVKDSGTFYSPAIKTNEKFKDEKEYLNYTLEAGNSYKLEICNVK